MRSPDESQIPTHNEGKNRPAVPNRADPRQVQHPHQQPLNHFSEVRINIGDDDQKPDRPDASDTPVGSYQAAPQILSDTPNRRKDPTIYIDTNGARIPLEKVKNPRRGSDFEQASTVNSPSEGLELRNMSAISIAQAEGKQLPSQLLQQPPKSQEENDKIEHVASCPNLFSYMLFGHGLALLMQGLGYYSAIEFACRALEVSSNINDLSGPYAFYSSIAANGALNTLCAAASVLWVFAKCAMIQAHCNKGERGKACFVISVLMLGVAAAIVTALPFHVLGLRLQEGSELFLKNQTGDTLNATLDAAMLELFETTEEPVDLTETWPYRLNEMYNNPNITDANRDTVALCQNTFVTPADTSFNYLAFNSWNMFTWMLIADAGGLIDAALSFTGGLFKEWSSKTFGPSSVAFLKAVIYTATVAAIASDLDALSTDKTSLLSDTQFVFLPAAVLITLVKRFESTTTLQETRSSDNAFVKLSENAATTLLLLSQAPLPVIANMWINETFDNPIMQNGFEVALLGALLVLIKFSNNVGGPLARDLKAIANFISQLTINVVKLFSCYKNIECSVDDFRQLLIASAELFSKLSHIIVYAATWPTLYAGFENVFLTVDGPLQMIFLAGIVVSSYAFNTGPVLKIMETSLTTPIFCTLINKALESKRLTWNDLNKELQKKMRTWEKNTSSLGGAWLNAKRQAGEQAASQLVSFPEKPAETGANTSDEKDTPLSCSQRFAMATVNTQVRREEDGKDNIGDKVWVLLQSIGSLVGNTVLTTALLTAMSYLNRTAIGIQSTNFGDDLSPYSRGASALMTLATALVIPRGVRCLNCSNPYKNRLIAELASTQQGTEAEADPLIRRDETI